MRFIIALFLCLLSGISFAWTPPKLYTKTLSNGLQIIVQKNTQSPAAIFEIWYKVGSIDEPLGQTGISHLLEHLMFRGTSDHPGGYFSRAISKLGGSDNAFTSYDYTAYVENLPSQDLAEAFKLEADRMKHLQFSVQTFQKEKQVVKEERLMRISDNPVSKLMERFAAIANIGSPRANPIIGWPSDLNQLSYDQTYDWYAKWYQPQDATIVIIGNVNPKNMFRLAFQYFGRMSGVQLPKQLKFKGLKNVGERQLSLALKAKVPTLAMGYKVPSLVTLSAQAQNQAYALMVLGAVLDGGASSRFEQNLIRQDRVATSISVSYNPLSRLDSQFKIIAVPTAGVSLITLEGAIEAELQNIISAKVSSKELQRVKQQAIAGQIYGMDSLFGTANEIGRIAVSGLPISVYQNYVNRIKAVTPREVQSVASKYFRDNNLTVGYLKPGNTGLKVSSPRRRGSSLTLADGVVA